MNNNEITKPLFNKSKWDIRLIPTKNDNCYIPLNSKSTTFKKRAFLNQSLNKPKYTHLSLLNNIKGFVVNVHGPTDFDIDLQIPCENVNFYETVISHKYTYKDIGKSYEFPINNILSNSGDREGIAYRCRLQGIGVKKNQNSSYNWKSNQLAVEIKHLIDRTDGWVICTLTDIDVYQRLLIDITINTINGPINLTKYLLNRMQSETEPIFFEYDKKNL